MDKKEYIQLCLEDFSTSPSTIAMILMDTYEDEGWVNFDSATILLDIRDEYGKIHKVNKEKIKAIQGLLSSDLFDIDWVTFSNIIKTFNDRVTVFTIPDPPRPHELVWGIIEADRLMPMDDDNKFSKEVLDYIKLALNHFGFYKIPKELRELNLNFELSIPEDLNKSVKSVQTYKLSQITEYVDAKNDKVKEEQKTFAEFL